MVAMPKLKKLTTKTDPSRVDWTTKRESPFIIAFRDKLQKGYTFVDLKPEDLKKWQNFLDIVSRMSFKDVDKRYRRDPDSKDIYQDEQVIHYGVSETFRVHGIIENAVFVVLRLDPRHKVHPQGKNKKRK